MVEEGRGLVVIVNKDLLRGRQNSRLYESVIQAVLEEIQTVIPQVTGIPVVFVSPLEGRGRIAVIHQVINTYEKWRRLPTAGLNRWLRKAFVEGFCFSTQDQVFHSSESTTAYHVAFVSGKRQLVETGCLYHAAYCSKKFWG